MKKTSLTKQSLQLFRNSIYLRAEINGEQDEYYDQSVNTSVNDKGDLDDEALGMSYQCVDWKHGSNCTRVNNISVSFWGPLTGFTEITDDLSKQRFSFYDGCTFLDLIKDFLQKEDRMLDVCYFDPILVDITYSTSTYYGGWTDESHFNIEHDIYVIRPKVRKLLVDLMREIRIAKRKAQA